MQDLPYNQFVNSLLIVTKIPWHILYGSIQSKTGDTWNSFHSIWQDYIVSQISNILNYVDLGNWILTVLLSVSRWRLNSAFPVKEHNIYYEKILEGLVSNIQGHQDNQLFSRCSMLDSLDDPVDTSHLTEAHYVYLQDARCKTGDGCRERCRYTDICTLLNIRWVGVG